MEKKSIRKTGYILLAAVAAIALIALAAVGCFSSSPAVTVEKFYQASLDNNCEKVRDLWDRNQDEKVAECEYYSDKLIGYQILGEKTRGIPYILEFAQVKAKVTLSDRTNDVDLYLVRTLFADWRLTEIR